MHDGHLASWLFWYPNNAEGASKWMGCYVDLITHGCTNGGDKFSSSCIRCKSSRTIVFCSTLLGRDIIVSYIILSGSYTWQQLCVSLDPYGTISVPRYVPVY